MVMANSHEQKFDWSGDIQTIFCCIEGEKIARGDSEMKTTNGALNLTHWTFAV